jgi:hypothetical protein
MRLVVAILSLLLLPTVVGCNRETGIPVPLRSFVLHDIQGLRGGRALWVGEDGAAVVQVVGQAPAGQSGLWEKRYNLRLTGEQWAEVERLAGAHHFLTLKFKERPAVPDESHAIIAIVTKAGTSAKATKLGSNPQSDFDPLYKYLIDICDGVGTVRPVHEGVFDWDWRPVGFDRLW